MNGSTARPVFVGSLQCSVFESSPPSSRNIQEAYKTAALLSLVGRSIRFSTVDKELLNLAKLLVWLGEHVIFMLLFNIFLLFIDVKFDYLTFAKATRQCPHFFQLLAPRQVSWQKAKQYCTWMTFFIVSCLVTGQSGFRNLFKIIKMADLLVNYQANRFVGWNKNKQRIITIRILNLDNWLCWLRSFHGHGRNQNVPAKTLQKSQNFENSQIFGKFLKVGSHLFFFMYWQIDY